MQRRLLSLARLSFHFASAIFAAPSAHATALWWDSNGNTAGTGATTAGIWGTSVFWTTDSTGSITPTTTNTTASDDLFFSAGTNAGTHTVTNTGARLANSLNFEEGTTTISGGLGTITLTSGIINVSSGAGTAVIGNATSMKIAGTNGLTKTGAGSVSLSNNAINTFTGGLFVYGGTITLGTANVGGGNVIDPSNAVTIAGGNLRVGGRNQSGVTSSQTLNGVTVGAGGGEILASRNGSGTATNVILGSLTATAAGGSLLVGTVPGATPGPVGITTTTNKDATTDIYGGRVVYSNGTVNTGYDWATSATSTGPGTPNTLASYAGYTPMPLSVGNSATNYSTSAGGTLSGPLAVNTLKVVGSATDLDLGANALTVASGGLLSTGTVAQTISGTAGATRLTAGNGSGSYDLIVHQYNSGGLTIGAVIGDNGGFATSLVKAGTGSLTLTGANTYTGTTHINGGTLLLGSTTALPASAPMSLAAKLETGGFSNSTGALTLGKGTNVIDFGTLGNNTLTFSNTAASVGSTLQIWNWSGTVGSPSGGLDKLVLSANSGSLNLANVNFYSGDNTGSPLGGGGATFLSGGSGELVPVPEPGALLSVAALLGAVGFRGRRSAARGRAKAVG